MGMFSLKVFLDRSKNRGSKLLGAIEGGQSALLLMKGERIHGLKEVLMSDVCRC